ncbi:MAG: TonB-dependent receptor [Janthinobacterium lividum]
MTANRRRELQRDVANSVTAISGQELDRKQEVRIQDLVSQVPGLSIEASDKTAVRIVLRGLNTGSAGTTVGSVLDDVPINPAGAQNNAATNTPNVDTYDLQRIEVLRGPQSTLYGATAEGGLIKYVTNPPDPTRYSGALETGVDGTTAGGIGGATKGFVNVPLWNGKAAIRVSAWNEWTPGYVDNPTTGQTNTNTAQQYGWRASLLVQPLPDLTVRLTAERQTLLSDNSDLVQVVGAALTPATPPANQIDILNGLNNATALPNTSQNETAVYYANVDYDLHWANLTSVTSFAYNNFKNVFDATNTNLAAGVTYGTYLGEAAYGGPVLVDERQNSNTDKFSQELRLSSAPGLTLFGRNLEMLGGAFYTHESSSLLQFLDARDASQPSRVLSPALGGLTLFGQLSEWAVFGQIDYHLLPGFDVAFGGRFEGTAQHSQTSDFCCLLYGSGSVANPLSSNDHDALYSVAPRWRLNDNTMIYGRIATGYRPGGPNVSVAGITNIPSYNPDKTINYEIGLRQDLFNKKVTVDITGYYIDWRNVQVLSILNTSAGPFTLNGNAGGAVSKGVEWSMNWVPLRGLTLSAVGDYTDTRLTQDAPGLGGAEGDFLPYVPNISASVTAEYRWNVFRDYNAYVSGTWSFTGERYTDFASNAGVTESHVQLPSYMTGAVRAGLENKRYGLEAFVTNISDERGLTYYNNSGGAGQTGQAAFIQPRTIGMTARVKF